MMRDLTSDHGPRYNVRDHGDIDGPRAGKILEIPQINHARDAAIPRHQAASL